MQLGQARGSRQIGIARIKAGKIPDIQQRRRTVQDDLGIVDVIQGAWQHVRNTALGSHLLPIRAVFDVQIRARIGRQGQVMLGISAKDRVIRQHVARAILGIQVSKSPLDPIQALCALGALDHGQIRSIMIPVKRLQIFLLAVLVLCFLSR